MRAGQAKVEKSPVRSGGIPWIHSLVNLLQGWARQLHKYTFVGGLVVIADFGLYALLIYTLGCWYLLAHLISRTVGGATCFLLNRYITFQIRGTKDIAAQMGRFVILYVLSFLLASILVLTNVQLFMLEPVIGKFIAETEVFLFNYTVMKYWVMTPNSKSKGLSSWN